MHPEQSDRRRSDRSGFTLIELLVALVLSAIIGGVVFQFLLGQERFVRTQSAREEVQQNARGAVEIMTSELRAVSPMADGLVSVGEEAIVFNAPHVWGVICGYDGGVMDVAFPSFPESVPTSGSYGVMVQVHIVDGTETSVEWRAVPVSSSGFAIGPNVAAPKDVCDLTLQGVDPLQNPYVARRFTGTVNPAPRRGSLVYLYETVQYDVSPANGSNPLWLRRNNGIGTQQPMAGPLVPTAGDTRGLHFAYFTANGTALAVAAANADRASIGQVVVRVRTQARGQVGSSRQKDDVSSRVYFRNTF